MPSAPAAPRPEAGGFFEDLFFKYVCTQVQCPQRLDKGTLKLEFQVSFPTWVLGTELLSIVRAVRILKC